MTTPGNPFTPGQREAVRRALNKVRTLVAAGAAGNPGSERGARKGRGVCPGRADEEDYGPRYEDS